MWELEGRGDLLETSANNPAPTHGEDTQGEDSAEEVLLLWDHVDAQEDRHRYANDEEIR